MSGPVPAFSVAWLAAAALASLQSTQHAILLGLGFAGAFVAGLVGIGGAIVMIPLLLYVPPVLGGWSLDMHTVAGITLVQVTAAGIVGWLAHRRRGGVDSGLVMTLGAASVAASLVGGLSSRLVSATALTGLFAGLAAVSAALLLGGPRHRLAESAGDLEFSRLAAIGLGLATGLLVGLVGAGGGFVLVPLMIYVLRVPVRVAVGTSLAIVALGAAAGTVGKGVTGQVDWVLALALVAGALPGARMGAASSHRVSSLVLARLLGVVIAVIAVKMWWDILRGSLS